jgi:hypothetical protein
VRIKSSENNINGQMKGQGQQMSGQTLRAIVDSTSGLNCFGFGLWSGHQGKPEEEQKAIFQQNRQHLLTQEESSFEQARTWIRANLEKRETVNDFSGSYGLKHLAEKEIGYITNGVFIAAMLAEGYTFQRSGPNAFFNASTRSIRAAQRRAWGMR